MDSETLKGKPGETRRMGKLLRQVLVGFKARLDDRLKDHGVSTAQLRLLFEVRERPGGSGAQMARACLVTPQSAQAMLARAVEHGWIVRGKDAENDRLVTFRLTPQGNRLLEYAEGVAREIEAEIWSGVSLAEIRTVSAILRRAADRLEE
jgi:DNA-binding MarR family transcriptional regulator